MNMKILQFLSLRRFLLTNCLRKLDQLITCILRTLATQATINIIITNNIIIAININMTIIITDIRMSDVNSVGFCEYWILDTTI